MPNLPSIGTDIDSQPLAEVDAEPVAAEIITIGSEILLGEIIDTNSATIARKLTTLGIPIRHTSTVGDHLQRLVDTLSLALARSEVVITTGGLGPTVDDMTREAVAKATGRPLVLDPVQLAHIQEWFQRTGRPMSENNRKQAYRPEGSMAIDNPVGTAPCFCVEQAGHWLISLPGVPKEMEYLLDDSVLPLLRQRLTRQGVIKSREIKLSGIGESQIDAQIGDLEQLRNPSVGLNAQSGVVVVRITAKAANDSAAEALIAPVASSIRERLGQWIFGIDSDTLEGVALGLIGRRGETLAVAESGTAGRLAGKLAECSGNTTSFLMGQLLPLERFGSASSLAANIAAQNGADWGMSCSLRQGEGQSEAHWAIWHQGHSRQWQRVFAGHTGLAAEWSSNMALNALRLCLLEGSLCPSGDR